MSNCRTVSCQGNAYRLEISSSINKKCRAILEWSCQVSGFVREHRMDGLVLLSVVKVLPNDVILGDFDIEMEYSHCDGT